MKTISTSSNACVSNIKSKCIYKTNNIEDPILHEYLKLRSNFYSRNALQLQILNGTLIRTIQSICLVIKPCSHPSLLRREVFSFMVIIIRGTF